MNWPPKLSWTSKFYLKGFCHYVAINYGIYNNLYWVNLVSVLDSRIRFIVDFEDLKESTHWACGWVDLKPEEFIGLNQDQNYILAQLSEGNQACLHLSEDSGLLIPYKNIELRQW